MAKTRANGRASDSDTDVEDIIAQAQLGVKRLKRKYEGLRKENEGLKKDIDATFSASEAAKSKRRVRGIEDNPSSTQKRVKELEGEIERLKRAQRRDRSKIKKFQERELKREAHELNDEAEERELEATDTTHKMRKLLRKYNDLLIAPTLPDDDSETCPVCFEQLKLKKTSSLPCQHWLCDSCLATISKGADETVNCAECRKSFPRDEIEVVHLRERDRWDALLDVAKEWEIIDNNRGEDETSEEEAEEEFVDNQQNSVSTSKQGSTLGTEEEEEEKVMEQAPGLPSRDQTPDKPVRSSSYQDSPRKRKQEEMENLIRRKKGRYKGYDTDE